MIIFVGKVKPGGGGTRKTFSGLKSTPVPFSKANPY
jgi:hypothetical protein